MSFKILDFYKFFQNGFLEIGFLGFFVLCSGSPISTNKEYYKL